MRKFWAIIAMTLGGCTTGYVGVICESETAVDPSNETVKETISCEMQTENSGLDLL